MGLKDQLAQAKEQNKKEQKSVRQKLIPKGFHLLTLKKVEFKLSSTNNPMFVLTIVKADDKNEDFKPLTEYLVISPDGLTTDFGMNLNLYTLITFLMNAFRYEIDELDEDDPNGDLLKKLKLFEGKSFRGIVAHKLESTSGGGVMTRAYILWRYVGMVDDPKINADLASTLSLFKDSTKRSYKTADTPPPVSDESDKVPF